MAFLVLAAVLTGGMFATGELTPRLGIDLAGGTSITLTATEDSIEEGAVTQENLNTAVSIIERRVNGLGVSEATVQAQGDRNIMVSIPKGTDEAQAREQVGTTAQMSFRPVVTIDYSTVLPEGTGEETGETGGTGDGTAEEDAGQEGEPGAEAEGGTGESTGNTGEESGEGATGDGATEDGASGETGEGTSDQSLAPPADTLIGEPATDATHASFRTDEQDPAAETEETAEATEDNGTPAAEDGTEDTEGTTEGATGDAAGLEGITADLAALDCSTPEKRLAAGRAAAQAEPDAEVVACGEDGLKYQLGPVAVPGTDLTGADAVFDTQQGKGWIVSMDFNQAGGDSFADITEELSLKAPPQNQFAIVLDGEVVSAPSVSERLGGGSAIIEGGQADPFTQQEAEDLANILKFGALPLTFEEGNVTTVSPTLGSEQLKAGLIAGGIGLLLVVGYLLFYYRLLGVVAIGSLAGMALLSYVVMTLLGPGIGFALSLPAICGAIVSIGITADSFIVYFERIRDEVREGRPIRAAIERAWPRARRTILVSDVVSILAALVLFIVSVGTVQGFAFVLGLTTALDVVVVFLLTKPMLSLLGRRRFFARGHKWSGLDPKRLGAPPPIRRGTRRPAVAPVPAEAKEA
ncbi:preprotein translocase subunit SecD [Streptomyces aidingensis]|uniref:Protein translocase subunit SecD n=1 Tax=Streptomyces aidingensis TaxID=910347 RepID=A0A1I1RTL8_9ACTN|nr:preprotein translocase subunit SecD [Streptomyces aidingensis]